MKCREIIDRLERLAPPEYACEWDNPGLLAGSGKKEVKMVLLALDASDDVVELAVREGADLVITHHPLIFKPLKKVNDEDFIARRILTLIRNDISYFAMHTNFDIAPGGMADLAAKRLGLSNCRPLEVTGTALPGSGQEGEPVGIGKIGRLPEAMEVPVFAAYAKERFGLPFVTAYGLHEVKGPVEEIAVCPGSGGSTISCALRAGVPVLLTGDIGHHEGIDAAACGLAIVDAGHYGLEYIFMDFMEGYLRRELGGQVKIIKAPVVFPAAVL